MEYSELSSNNIHSIIAKLMEEKENLEPLKNNGQEYILGSTARYNHEGIRVIKL